MTKFAIDLLPNKIFPVQRQATIIDDNIGKHLSINYVKQLSPKQAIHTNITEPSIGITLWSPSKKIATKSTPSIDVPLLASRQLINIITNLRNSIRKSYEEIIAVLVGGVSYIPNDSISIKSVELIDKLYKTLQNEGIETTMIAGRFCDSINSKVNTYVTDRKMFLWGKPFDNKGLHTKNSQNEIEEILSHNFDFVKISPDAPINIIDSLPTSTKRLVK